MRNHPFSALYRAELRAQFTSATTYVFLIIYLVMHALLTFRINTFFDTGECTMAGAFFFHPWLYLILIPALSMHVWADERHDGTLELLVCAPIALRSAVMAKYAAAMTVVLCALLGTLPMVGTLYALGTPDTGVLLTSYLGSFLTAALFMAIGCFTSALTRSHIIGFILAFVIAFFINALGATPTVDFLRDSDVNMQIVDIIAAFSSAAHFQPMQEGMINISGLVYFLSVTAFFLYLNIRVLETHRSR